MKYTFVYVNVKKIKGETNENLHNKTYTNINIKRKTDFVD